MRRGECATGMDLHQKDLARWHHLPPPKQVAVVDGPKSNKKRTEQEVEAEMTKTRYMGADTNTSTFSAKKKRKRTTEKKFNFEWNTEEDTSPRLQSSVCNPSRNKLLRKRTVRRLRR